MGQHGVHAFVRPVLVVMEEAEAGHTCGQGELQGVGIEGMPPAASMLVVGQGVLRVVEEEVRALGEGDVLIEAPAAAVGKGELVVREEDEGLAIFLEAISYNFV